MSIDTRLSAALADRYRIERELGAGGMATVYLCDDLEHYLRPMIVRTTNPRVSLADLYGEETANRMRLTPQRYLHYHA